MYDVAGRAHRADSGPLRTLLLAGTTVTERRLELAGVSTTELEAGSGPPMVLLHGAIECGGAVWAPVIARLAQSHRLVIPDLTGLGESDPVDRLDPSTFAAWFTALLRQTGIDRPTLVARSMGGSLAVRFAVQHGELLRRLVLYGAPGIGPYRLPLGLLVLAVRFSLRPTEQNNERFDRWAFADLDRARRQDADWFRAFGAYNLARAVVPHVKMTMGRLIKSGKRQVPDADIRRITIPTALVWGRHDRFVPVGLGERASTTFGWPLHVIDDVGHVPHLERPEAFLRVLAEIESASATTTASTTATATTGAGTP